MSASIASGTPPRPNSGRARIAWHWRHDPKLELWLAWYMMVGFYNMFGIVFVLMTRVMPPPKPYWDEARIARWFMDNHTGLIVGFGIIFLTVGLTAACNALIGYSIRRMSVSRAYAYSYIAIYSLSATPGMLITALVLVVGAMRPDRDPALLSWLYDAAFMCFDGTMGIFLIGTLIWMTAILLDRNGVFPLWFAFLNICNAITEIVVAPAWIFKSGAFAWNGVIAFWIDTFVFAGYTGVFIALLMQMIKREDFGDGALPPPAKSQSLPADRRSA
jgi:hypothetical protein